MRYFKLKEISEKYDKVNKKFCEQFSTPLKNNTILATVICCII